MAGRKIDPKEQFSKKLAGRTEWFWFFYMILLCVVMALQPASALSAVYLGVMATGVMVISVMAYTKNSIDEKWFYWLAEIAKAISGKQDDEDDEEGGSNG